MVPTYGGPYDSYTIPVRQEDGSFCRERYDHDQGWWVTDEVEDVGVQIISDQACVSNDPPSQLVELTPKDVHAIWAAVKPDWHIPRGAVTAVYEHIVSKLREKTGGA